MTVLAATPVVAGAVPTPAAPLPSTNGSGLLVPSPAGPGASAASEQPAATSSTEYLLGDDGASVKVDGATWILSVDYTADSPDNTLAVGLERLVTSGGKGEELHVWGFAPTSTSDLTFDSSTGDGTLDSAKTADPVAAVDLAFSATSHQAAACTSGSETIYTGTLTGSVTLTTGLTNGGTVHGKSLTFDVKGSSPSITADDDCVPAINDCESVTIFLSSSSEEPGVLASGIEGTLLGATADEIGVVDQTDLSAPAGAVREDGAELSGKFMKWSASTKTLSVSSSTSGIVTGSATLTGGKVTKGSTTCTFDGTTYKLSALAASDATYSSPSGEALTAHTLLSGDLAAPNSTDAGYEVLTAKKT